MRFLKFGKAPSGERLAKIQTSGNYKNGKFQNLSPTRQLAEGHSVAGITYSFLFKKKPRRKPLDSIPSLKTDLLHLPKDSNVLVWFGHSSYFIQLDGKRILVDPVFSGNASPLAGTNKSFEGSDIYTTADLPDIDYLFITHDHYDHLDYETVIAIKDKVGNVICGLGVGSHFEYWGYAPGKIIEMDWNEKAELDGGFTVHATPARHFSGRGFVRNNTLWVSFVLQSPHKKIFLGGDSGYDTHFADIGNRFGPFDLAIMENGQYDEAWPYIHASPDQTLKAAKELKAKYVFPVHSSKFTMGNHPWDEPLQKISELNKSYGFPLLTPRIGEPVNLDDMGQPFKEWWVGIK